MTDEDYEDDLDISNDDFRGSISFPESSFATFSEEELILTEETLTSSLETVICRSETEESELTECFTKSINLNTENDIMNSVILDNSKHTDYKKSFDKSNNVEESGIGIEESSELKEHHVFSDNLRKRPNTAHSSKIQKSSLIKTVKPGLPASKSYCKLTLNSLTKRNTVLDPRPSTAPVKRACCKMGIMTKLPVYNGLRSEYGLSREQLLEREK